MHVAPHLGPFLDAHPGVHIDLVLSDSFVDLVAGGFDLAIRIGELPDSSLVVKRLAPNHRVLCASPAYLARHGAPQALADLSRHALIAHNADHWRLEGPPGIETVRIEGRLRTNSSEVVREAALAGLGIALRSTWDVGPDLKAGRLVHVLPEWSGGRRIAIHAVYPSRRHMEQKVRVFIAHLTELYAPLPYWDEGLAFA